MSDIRKALEEIEQWFEKREAVAGDLGALDEQLEMAGLAGRVAGLRAALAQPQAAQPDGWEANVSYLLEKCPYTVRQRPGGGEEDLIASLVVTFQGMQMRLQGYPLFATLPTEPAPVSRTVTDTPGMPGCKDITTRYKIAQPAPQAEPAVTEEMVTAYLTANDAYWKRVDGEPTKLGKWRNGTPSEATRVSLEAALASAPHAREPQAFGDLTGVSPCCGDYANCHRPCTPRGRWEGERTHKCEPLKYMQLVLLWGHRSDGPSNAEIVSFAREVEKLHGIG